jgi:hypothetical protein
MRAVQVTAAAGRHSVELKALYRRDREKENPANLELTGRLQATWQASGRRRPLGGPAHFRAA